MIRGEGPNRRPFKDSPSGGTEVADRRRDRRYISWVLGGEAVKDSVIRARNHVSAHFDNAITGESEFLRLTGNKQDDPTVITAERIIVDPKSGEIVEVDEGIVEPDPSLMEGRALKFISHNKLETAGLAAATVAMVIGVGTLYVHSHRPQD